MSRAARAGDGKEENYDASFSELMCEFGFLVFRLPFLHVVKVPG